jgi:cytochrome c5
VIRVQDDAPHDVPRKASDDGKSKSDATERHDAAAPAPASLATGAVVADRYEIGRVLGPGVAGKVYAARDRQKARDVALEVLAPPWIVSESARQRFITEFTIARSLSHANIVHVHDVGATADCIYLSMELLRGKSLRRRLTANPGTQVPLQEVFGIARQLIDALQHAQRIIVHRDLKPENLWLSDDGTVKVMGFGIARALLGAESGEIRPPPDDPHYLAPEQCLSAKNVAKNVDWRADQYSLAMVLYELLTRSMATAESTVESLAVLRPDVPPRFAAAVLRALSAAPEDRWPSWQALQAELEIPRRAAPLRVAAIAALGLALAGGVGFYWYSREPQLPAPASRVAGAPQVADEAVLEAQQETPLKDSAGGSPSEPAPSAEIAGGASSEGRPASSAEQDARGQEIFAMACVACHGSGAAGAPMLGDATAWGPRVAQGSAVLYERALQGYQGKSGFMPPRGGRVDLSDQSVIDAVDYMVVNSK